jgi:hypothetical protein
MRVIDDMGTGTVDRLSEHLDGHLPDPYGTVPKGRKGLFRALAGSVAPASVERALPVTDTAAMGVEDSMFDYDPELATDLMTD